jgi:hypothetical protein
MRALRWSVVLLVVAAAALPGPVLAANGEAEPAPADDSAEETLSVEEILNEPAAADEYGDSPRCIQTTRIRDTQVLDGQHIVFRVRGDKYYLVRLDFACPRLRRGSGIMYESSGRRLCTLSWVRAISGFGGSSDFGPPCQIPGFQEITREQVDLLKDQLKNTRRRERIDEEPAPKKDAADSP